MGWPMPDFRRFSRIPSFAGVLILAAGLWLLPLQSAQAGLITYDFSGTVSLFLDNGGYFGGNIAVGDAVTGSVFFSDAATDSDPSQNRGVYLPAPPDYGIVMVFHGAGGTMTWATGSSAYTTQVFVHDDYFGMDQFFTQQYQTGTDCGPAPVDGSTCLMTFELRDETPPLDLLSSDALPLSLDVAKAQAFAGGFLLSYKQIYDPATGSSQQFDDYWILFRLDSVGGPAGNVPQPATLALFGAGLAGLGALCRRRRA
jgi:PEP-CTERM motif